MTTTILGVFAFAALFALAARLRSARGCASKCGTCANGCKLMEDNHEHS
jgi:bacterioferritin-associated ferredoxin